MPNVGDLPDWAPRTEVVPLVSGGNPQYTITARRTRRVNVRRRPCSSRPGYSLSQCLKECQWRWVAAHVGCRLPHMVGAGVFLSKMGGFMDHLPICSRLPTDTWPEPVPVLIPGSQPCTNQSRNRNMSFLFEDFCRYMKKRWPIQACLRRYRIDNRTKRITTEMSSPAVPGLLSARSSAFTIPEPPPLKYLSMPARAFVILPNGIFDVSHTSFQCPLACDKIIYTVTEKFVSTVNDSETWNRCVAFFSILISPQRSFKRGA